MEAITLNVPTVHCRSCKLNIEESLEEVAGVASSNVDVDAKNVVVNYDPATIDASSIRAAVIDAGYEVSDA